MAGKLCWKCVVALESFESLESYREYDSWE